MQTWAAALGGVASILIGWALPMMAPTLPHVVQILVLAAGTGLLLVSFALSFFHPGTKHDSSGISVKMRDRNTIRRIGNDWNGPPK